MPLLYSWKGGEKKKVTQWEREWSWQPWFPFAQEKMLKISIRNPSLPTLELVG